MAKIFLHFFSGAKKIVRTELKGRPNFFSAVNDDDDDSDDDDDDDDGGEDNDDDAEEDF